MGLPGLSTSSTTRWPAPWRSAGWSRSSRKHGCSSSAAASQLVQFLQYQRVWPLTLKCRASWPLASMLPIAAISLAGQVLSRPSSRVRSPGSPTGAVALRSQTALTGSDRPWTIPQREHGHPAAERPVTAVQRRPASLPPSRQPTGVGPAVAGAPAECRRGRRGGGASGPAGRLETVQKVLTGG